MEILTAVESTDQQRRIAGGLLAGGVRAGDRVALQTTSSGLMLSGILGALRVGIVPVLLNAGLLDHERVALLDDAGPARVIDDAELARLVSSAPTDLAPHPLARPMHYTSGTTGEPKGVWTGVLDDAEAGALVGEEADLWQFDADDRHLVCSPFHHSVAIRFGGGTLLAGGTLLILGAFEAHAAASAIAIHRPTTTFMGAGAPAAALRPRRVAAARLLPPRRPRWRPVPAVVETRRHRGVWPRAGVGVLWLDRGPIHRVLGRRLARPSGLRGSGSETPRAGGRRRRYDLV
jgi:acyl-CoA synthetase (AMP-forming)/AMP-acid ligase II